MSVFAKTTNGSESKLNVFEYFDGKVNPFDVKLFDLILETKIPR